MKTKLLKRKIILILLIISMLVPYVPVFTPVSEAASQLTAKTGYHINYHNGGNWTNYGQSIPGCDNAIVDPNSRQCYHYLNKDIITGQLYDDDGNILTKRFNTSDGGTWDVSGEYMYGHYEGSNFVATSYEVPGYNNFKAKKDVRIYYFISSCPDCEAHINGKYVKGLMYYKWMWDTSIYGFENVNFPGNTGGTGYPVTYNGGTYYQYFAGYNNLAGEGLNSRGLYPSFDCAIYNRTSRGISGYDSSGNPVWNDNAVEGYIWNAHTHTVYKYKCGGHYEPNTYTVTYKANGGTGSTGNTYHTYDQNGNLANNGFSRTGYTFGGWTDGTNTYSAGQTVKNLTATNGGVITLSAIWNRSQFNLKVRPNGGTWNGSTAEQNFTMTYQDRKSINNPTRTGYRFTGWSLSGKGATLDGTAFTMGTGDATLTANWEKINYNLNVNPNGGTWEGSTSSQNFTMTYQDRKSINNPTRIGFTFTGWSLSGTGSTLDGTAFTMGYDNATLTANWTRNNYNLTVNPNEGTWEGSTSSQNFTIAYEGNKTISNPVRYGYSFNGWTLEGDGSSLNGTTFRMGYNNATLTANWSLITHNITGTVTWEDQNNKYSSRPENVTVTLSRNPTTGEVTPIPTPVQIKGNATYAFNNVQTYDTTSGNAYTYQVAQNKVPGYKTTINTYNITNKLIVPTYTSNVSYSPIDTYKSLYLKNGKVKITANIQSTSGNTYPELGLNNGIVNFQVDPDITLDTNTLKIYHTDNNGTRKQITNYKLNGNVLTVDFGENKISKSKDKIEIEVYGTLNKIKEYSSRISLTGNLRAYDGENTNINLGTLTTKTAKITAQYQMPQANIKITKHDSITEQNLTDATFTLYEWNGNAYVEKETIQDTNNDGIYESKYYEWNKVTEGKYKIVETGVPANHKNLEFSMEFTINQLKTENYTITPDYSNKEYKITYNVRTPDDFDNTNGIVENEPYKIKASIDLLDSENLKQIQNEATFKIYEWDKQTKQYKIYTSYTTGKEVKIIRQENKTYITEEWLYYTSNNEGKFRIVEEKAPTGYYGDYEDDNAESKRTYDINVIDLVGTNGSKNETTIALSNKDGKFVNQRTKAIINLNKVDSETKGAPQGDATLQDAVYEIYASENIYHADGKTSNYDGETALLYRKDQLVAEKTTNEEGKLAFDNLECGKYYIKEKTPSNGYLLDEETYEIDVTYQNETIKLITKEQTSEEKVKKQGFQIYKIKQTDRTEYEGLQDAGFTIYRINSLSIVKDGKITKNEDGTYTLNDNSAKNDPALRKLANRNGTYNIQDLVDYYYKIKYTENDMGSLPQDQNSYHPYNINEEMVKNYASSTQGSYIGELKSNGDGYIRSPELAYGEYIVIETTVPKNLETAKPFYINVQNDSRAVQKLKFITDENFETKIKIYKVDQTTGKTVLKSGAKYVIRNEAGDLMTINSWDATDGYVEYGTFEHPFVTGADGYLVTPMSLPVGRYTLEEIEAPDGYVLAGYEGTSKNAEILKNPQTKTTFEISTNAIYYTDDFLDTNVIVVKQQNQPQLGSLELSTEGDYVSSVNKNTEGNYEFTYETRPIAGATYEIRAKENILTTDGHNTIIYTKDQLVSTVTSNNDGIAYVDNLPQGKYYIVQKIAGNGFSLNEEQKEFEVKYGTNQENLQIGTKEWKAEAQETPVVHIKESYKNQKQEIQITINKTDTETSEKLEGAEIGLYVGEDIVNKATNKVILAKDTMVDIQTTNEEGKIIFGNNLPLGQYYVKETKAPTGYIYNGESKIVDGTYDSSQIATKQIDIQIKNEKTNINIQKTTKEGSSLSGATLELRDSKDQVIETWTTTEETKNIKSLKTNEQYKIIETSPAVGYVTAKEITFIINDEGIVQTEAKIKEPNTIIMEDQTTKIIVELLDAKTKEQVSGATLKIVNEKGEEVAKFETSNIAEEIEKLPIGKYTLVEEKAPVDKGYVTIEQVPFEIRDTEETQRVVITQEYTKLQISLKDIETKEPVVRATLQLIKKTEENEQILDEWVTMVEPHLIEKLPVGKYYIRETQTPTDRGYVTINEQEIEVKDTLQIQNVELLNDVTKVKVNLIDKDEKTNIVGAILQIIKKDTNEVVREWETTDEPYNTQRLPVGTYIVKNKKANTELGQVTVNSEELTIIDTDKVQEITIEQDYTKLEVELLDKETLEKLEGVKLEIYKVNKGENGEKIRGEKVRDFVTGKENYNTTRLPVGEYLIHQVENQEEILQNEGFVTLQDTYFEIEDNPEVKKVSLEQDYTKVEVEVLDKETKQKVEGIQLQIHSITTDEDGKKTRGELVREFITGKENYNTIKLPVGEYLIHEPDGQKEVLQNQGYATLEDVYFTVENNPEVKKVTIEQDFTKVEVELLDKETKEKVEGVKFEIYRVNVGEDGKKQQGEKIREFVTGKENYLTTRIPTGEYLIHEVEGQTESLQNKGYATIEDTYFTVEDVTETKKVSLEQDYTKVEVELIDKETREKIEGVKFEIYKVNVDKNGEKQQGEKIREFTTEKENYNTIKLPVGEYLIHEINNQKESLLNKGYASIEDTYFIVEDRLDVQKTTLEQDYTKLEVEVLDKETKEKIEDVKFEIYKIEINENGTKQQGEKVRELITGKDNYSTIKLPVGEYLIHEVEGQIESLQNKGYATINDQYFNIEDKKEVQKITIEQDYTKLEVELIDKETKEKVEGVKLEIYKVSVNENGEKQRGDKVKEFTTGEDNYSTIKLPVGDYLIHEVENQKEAIQDKGYATIEDKYFVIEDRIEVQKVTIEQDYTKVEIELIDKETKEPVEGVKVEIYEVIIDENGEKKPGEKVDEFITGKDNKIIEKLPVGEYIIHEVEDQEDTLLNKGYTTMEDIYFTVEDKVEIQKVEIEQTQSRLEIELVDKDTKEKIQGSKLQIIKVNTEGKEEIVKEIETKEENAIIEKLPIGEYILRQTEDGIKELGYVRIEDKKFKIIDTVKTQKMIVEQDYTKVQIKVVDIDTKELVLGSTITLQDKDGNAITEDWLSTKEPKLLTRLPVGEYYIVEKEAPTLRGYVKVEKVEITVEETSDIQEFELEQDYTKLSLVLVDKETKEEIKEADLIVKDEKGNKVAEISLNETENNTEDNNNMGEENTVASDENQELNDNTVTTEQKIKQVLTRLPVGKYVVESTSMQYGYKPLKAQIEVKDTREIQIKELEVEREIFDIQVEEWIGQIVRNGKQEYLNEKEEQTVKKLDVKDKRIPTEDIKITYKIRVKNIGKITGQVGKIEVSIPMGMEFIKEANKGYWQEENGKIITTGLAGRELKEGAYADLEITLRWKNGLENFGTKSNTVRILEVTSDIGFKEANEENNIAKAKDVIIGVSTGEMNILWACWVLLIFLILVEVYVSKKLHIKNFKIKDKTLKYRDKK